jgi:hypothetical protein
MEPSRSHTIPRRIETEAFPAPSFYDKHLRKDLILKEVKSLSSLQQAIAGVVDRTLSSIQQRDISLPQTGIDRSLLRTENERRVRDQEENQPMRNEESVANFYSKTTGLLRSRRFDSRPSPIYTFLVQDTRME